MKSELTTIIKTFMTTRYRVGFLTLIVLLSCSPEKPDVKANTDSFEMSITEDGTDIPFSDNSIQVDFGTSGVAGLYSFDIAIHDYFPQTFSIDLVSYIPFAVEDGAIDLLDLEVDKSYPIGNWDPLADDYQFYASFAHKVNWEPYELTDTEFDEVYYDTSLYGYGTVVFTEITEDRIKGKFNFTAQTFFGIQVTSEVYINCTSFVAEKRVFAGD